MPRGRGRGRGRRAPPPSRVYVPDPRVEELQLDKAELISKNSRHICEKKVLAIKLQARDHQVAQLKEELATIKSASSSAAAASITSAPVTSASSNRASSRAPTSANAPLANVKIELENSCLVQVPSSNSTATSDWPMVLIKQEYCELKHDPDCDCAQCLSERIITSDAVSAVDSPNLTDAQQERQEEKEGDDDDHHQQPPPMVNVTFCDAQNQKEQQQQPIEPQEEDHSHHHHQQQQQEEVHSKGVQQQQPTGHLLSCINPNAQHWDECFELVIPQMLNVDDQQQPSGDNGTSFALSSNEHSIHHLLDQAEGEQCGGVDSSVLQQQSELDKDQTNGRADLPVDHIPQHLQSSQDKRPLPEGSSMSNAKRSKGPTETNQPDEMASESLVASISVNTCPAEPQSASAPSSDLSSEHLSTAEQFTDTNGEPITEQARLFPWLTPTPVQLPACDPQDPKDKLRAAIVSTIMRTFAEGVAIVNNKGITSEDEMVNSIIDHLLNNSELKEDVKPFGARFQSKIWHDNSFSFQSVCMPTDSEATREGRMKAYHYLTELMSTLKDCKQILDTEWDKAAKASPTGTVSATEVINQTYGTLKALHPKMIIIKEANPNRVHLCNVKRYGFADVNMNIQHAITFLYTVLSNLAKSTVNK